MSDPNFTAEWRNREAFAEAAETLGVPTDCIMATAPDGNNTFVLFTYADDDPDNPRIYRANLRRDGDGILRRTAPPREVPGMWENMKANAEAQLRDKFGPPPTDAA